MKRAKKLEKKYSYTFCFISLFIITHVIIPLIVPAPLRPEQIMRWPYILRQVNNNNYIIVAKNPNRGQPEYVFFSSKIDGAIRDGRKPIYFLRMVFYSYYIGDELFFFARKNNSFIRKEPPPEILKDIHFFLLDYVEEYQKALKRKLKRRLWEMNNEVKVCS